MAIGGPVPESRAEEVEFARGVLRAEADAVAGLARRLDDRFATAVDLLQACADAGGTVLITGLGKSGHVGVKIAATMTSLGLAAHFVHPTEAAHGDLGRFRKTDLVVALSFSGETDEVVNLVALLRQDGLPVIALCRERPAAGEGQATLAQLATVTLDLGVDREAGAPHFEAPTCSTTATLALGDALALAAARRRSFTSDEFRRRHPGGTLGSLMRPVLDLLRFRAGESLTLIPQTASVSEALASAAGARRAGALVIVDDAGRLAGIFTDGDLRRLILKDTAQLRRPIAEVMTRSPRHLAHDALVRDAVLLFREHRQDEIPVIDASGRPLGVLDVQDLIAMRLVRD